MEQAAQNPWIILSGFRHNAQNPAVRFLHLFSLQLVLLKCCNKQICIGHDAIYFLYMIRAYGSQPVKATSIILEPFHRTRGSAAGHHFAG